MRVKSNMLALVLVLWSTMAPCAEPAATDRDGPYDSNPKHLWNQLSDTLFIRTAPDGARYGRGQLDILFWPGTRYLLTEPSHTAALRILDRFIREHGERLSRDPLKRVLLQRDLWKLFDWAALPSISFPPEDQFAAARAQLARRLAVIIDRLALTDSELASLPDNYAIAQRNGNPQGLPSGLFDPAGDWVMVGNKFFTPTASVHVADFNFDGRSLFLVMVRLPQGRQQTIEYINTLHNFEGPLILAKRERGVVSPFNSLALNPAVPQFPAGTEWALVRRLYAIDAQRLIHATALVESIQVRHYLSVPAGPDQAAFMTPGSAAQRFSEFDMDPRQGASLTVVPDDRRDFVQFHSMEGDPIEFLPKGRPVQTVQSPRECQACHASRGILSVNSYNRALAGGLVQLLDVATTEEESTATVNWKYRRYDWGLLQGLWQQH
jgi:hypothetical protein